MTEKVLVKSPDLIDRKALKEDLKNQRDGSEKPPAPPAVPKEVDKERPKLIGPHYATVTFHTNLGPPNSRSFVQFHQFMKITDQYALYWLLEQKESRVVPYEVDSVQCPKCKTVFAGVPCLAQ